MQSFFLLSFGYTWDVVGLVEQVMLVMAADMLFKA